MPRTISIKTYRDFAKRYKIKITKNGKYKTMKQLQTEIYNHEKNDESIIDGLYFIAN